jgi:triacylglycerol lipase
VIFPGSMRSGVAVVLGALALGCGSESSGEGFVQLDGAGGAGSGGAGATTTGTTTTHTSTGGGGGGAPALGPPYPIVLAHGFFGFDDFAGAGFLDYYYGVKAHLAEGGEALVFTPAVDPFNDSTARGEQLLAEVEAILAQTGHAKVNLVGHSQGGLDARVVAALRPDLVASVVTVATPHEGTRIADIALGLTDDPALAGVLDFLVDTVGQALYDEVGAETSLAAALEQLTTSGMDAFNVAYPDQPGVLYASIAGRSDRHGGGTDCNAPGAPPFIAAWDDALDPLDVAFSVTEPLLDGGLGDPYPNDGLVRVRDAKRGRFLGCIPADHLDEVGQLFGDGPGLFNDWDHLAFYRDLARYLRDQGL